MLSSSAEGAAGFPLRLAGWLVCCIQCFLLIFFLSPDGWRGGAFLQVRGLLTREEAAAGAEEAKRSEAVYSSLGS